MDKIKMLSGEELLDKGVTKQEVTLPVIGLKDVTPDGSWLEQKQTQSALDARKHLVDAQRIEKRGILSHAKWQEELKLAEVTQQAGGHWSFMGHHKEKKLYLRPEEALYLIEVNSLLLTYNDIVVSLQQAYSLLLRNEVSINKYKVYASLSRLGYKIFYHNSSESTTEQTEIEIHSEGNNEVADNILTTEETEVKINSEGINEVADNIPTTKETEVEIHSEGHIEVTGNISTTEETVVNHCEGNIEVTGNISRTEETVVNHCERNIEVTDNISTTKETEVENHSEGNIEVTDNIQNLSQELNTGNDVDISKSADSGIQQCDNIIKETQTGDIMETDLEGNAAAVSTDVLVDNESKETDMDVHHTDCNKNLDNTEEVENISKNVCKKDNKVNAYECSRYIVKEKDPLTKFIEWKLKKLKARQLEPKPKTDVHKHFENIPDLSENRIVTMNVPKEELLPKNIFLNNLTYVLDIKNVASRDVRSLNTETMTYSIPDEVNGDHVRRVTSSMQNRPQTVNIPPFYQSFRQNTSYRQFHYWRPRPNLNYFHFNLFFQRPFMTNFNMPRFQFYPRTHIPMFPRYFTSPTHVNSNSYQADTNREETRKRKKDSDQKLHLESIKNLAARLRVLVAAGNTQIHNIEALQKLINTYNARYRANIRLTDEFEIIDVGSIIETIELDDDGDTRSKKRRLADDNANLNDLHLNQIRQMALRLKQLEVEGKASPRHRRAISNLVKTFNKSYNADIYISVNNVVLDRRSIILDSSSDSECVVEEMPKPSGKKLRNPFNILKRLSEKRKSNTSTKSSKQKNKSDVTNESNKEETSKNYILETIFGKGWLPSLNDFGKPEVSSRDNMNIRIIESKKEEYLFEFLKDNPFKFNNWVDTKIAFLENIEKTNDIFRTEAIQVDSAADIKSIIKSEDCTDMPSVLKKLSIIRKMNDVNCESTMTVDFDVYNRDVQNFRKGCRSTPHFRIVCLDATSPCPSFVDVATLHSKYKDDVMMVFAIVGSSSISFLQMIPTDMPVYVSGNNLG